jgi:uncharacterized protein (DUF58 family)
MVRRTFDDAFLKRLDALSIISRKMVTGRAKGERRSFRKGAGVEFQDYRAYVVGDDFRYVDWNIYSRLDKLFLKLYVEEEDLCLHLLVDGSASMGFGDPPKLDYALQVAVALGYIGLTNLERVALGYFQREQSAEDRVPREGRCCRQYRIIELFIDSIIFTEQFFHDHPLIQSKTIDNEKEHGFAIIQFREDETFDNFGG